MAVIADQNPPHPRVPDENEQRLEDKMKHSMSKLLQALQFYVCAKAASFVFACTYLGFMMEFIACENRTFLDYYYMLMGFYYLFFILPVLCVSCRDGHYLCFIKSMLLLVGTELVVSLVEIFSFNHLKNKMLHPELCSFSVGIHLVNMVIYSFAAYQIYQWYLVSKELEQYQLGTCHRISILPKSVMLLNLFIILFVFLSFSYYF